MRLLNGSKSKSCRKGARDMNIGREDGQGRGAFRTATAWALAAVIVLLGAANVEGAAGKPKTVAEIALYQGSDREKLLIEGAKKEGKLMFYTTHTWMAKEVPEAFEKKYPFFAELIERRHMTDLVV